MKKIHISRLYTIIHTFDRFEAHRHSEQRWYNNIFIFIWTTNKGFFIQLYS